MRFLSCAWVLLALTVASCGGPSTSAQPRSAPTRMEGPVSPLYVAEGDQVRGGGYIVALDGKVRLCGRLRIYDGGFPQGPPKQCEKGIDLTGFDTSLLPKVAGGRAGNGS